jgi:hypothetical protein
MEPEDRRRQPRRAGRRLAEQLGAGCLGRLPERAGRPGQLDQLLVRVLDRLVHLRCDAR